MNPLRSFSRWFNAQALSAQSALTASRAPPVSQLQPTVPPVVRLDRWMRDGFERFDRGELASQFVSGARSAEQPRQSQAAASRFVDAFEPAVRAPVALNVPGQSSAQGMMLEENHAGMPPADFVASLADLGELAR